MLTLGLRPRSSRISTIRLRKAQYLDLNIHAHNLFASPPNPSWSGLSSNGYDKLTYAHNAHSPDETRPLRIEPGSPFISNSKSPSTRIGHY